MREIEVPYSRLKTKSVGLAMAFFFLIGIMFSEDIANMSGINGPENLPRNFLTTLNASLIYDDATKVPRENERDVNDASKYPLESTYSSPYHIPTSQPRLYTNYPMWFDVSPRKCVPRPKTLYDRKDIGFAIGAFNHYASSNRYFGAVAAIESLVKIGGWGGKIYLITMERKDGEISCFSESYLRNLTGNPNIYVTDKLSTGSSGGGYAKAQMFNIVNEVHNTRKAGPPPTYLIWHDADHLWAQAGCVKSSTLTELPKFGPKSTMFWHPVTFRPNHPNDGRDNHVGTFIAHRYWSKFTLKKWGEMIMETPHEPDYNPLHRAWHSHQDKIKPSTSPENLKDHMWNYNENGCHNHMSYFGRCRANGARRAQHFISSLCLETLEGPGTEFIDVNYCGCFNSCEKDAKLRKELDGVKIRKQRWCEMHGNKDGSVR